MSHTKEPWFYSKSKHGIDGGHDVIASIENGNEDMSLLIHAEGEDFNSEENARRIVACVNFCAEVSIEKLESSRCGEYQKVLLKERDTYRELCVGLLAFANTVKEYAEKYPHDTGLYDLVVCEIKKLEQLK